MKSDRKREREREREREGGRERERDRSTVERLPTPRLCCSLNVLLGKLTL